MRKLYELTVSVWAESEAEAAVKLLEKVPFYMANRDLDPLDTFHEYEFAGTVWRREDTRRAGPV